jgi:hypothetical protein
VDRQQGGVKGREDGAILWLGSRGIDGSGGGALDGFNAEVGERKREREPAQDVGKEEKGRVSRWPALWHERHYTEVSDAPQKLSLGGGVPPGRERELRVGRMWGERNGLDPKKYYNF